MGLCHVLTLLPVWEDCPNCLFLSSCQLHLWRPQAFITAMPLRRLAQTIPQPVDGSKAASFAAALRLRPPLIIRTQQKNVFVHSRSSPLRIKAAEQLRKVFTTAALEREPLPDGVRSSWGGQCRAGPQRKGQSGSSRERHLSISCFHPLSICLLCSPISNIPSRPPFHSSSSPSSSSSTYLFNSFVSRLPPPFLWQSVSDSRRQADDLQHQEKWRRHVRVRGDQHGWGERQRSCRAEGVWWVTAVKIHESFMKNEFQAYKYSSLDKVSTELSKKRSWTILLKTQCTSLCFEQ